MEDVERGGRGVHGQQAGGVLTIRFLVAAMIAFAAFTLVAVAAVPLAYSC